MKRLKKIISLVMSSLILGSLITSAKAYEPQVFGDINDDGIINVADKAILIRMITKGIDETQAGDIDCDGFVSFSDNIEIGRFLLGVSDKITCVHPTYIGIPDEVELEKGAELQLEPEIYPSDCLDPSIIWKSSDKNIAEVENGLITAVDVGEVTITAYSMNGYNAQCLVKIISSTEEQIERNAVVTNVNATSSLRVRSIPSTDGEILGSFSPEQSITVIGDEIDGWYQVRGIDRLSGQIVEGYSSADYITIEGDTTTTPDVPEDFAEKIAQIRIKFPAGKYWNHAVGSANTPDLYTEVPCDHHVGECLYDGSCGCNSFDSAIQCMGFAFKVGYDLYGTSPRKWTAISYDEMQPGDYLRYNGHSMIVLTKTDSGITVLEANYDSKCGIFWDRFISAETLAKYTLDIRTH